MSYYYQNEAKDIIDYQLWRLPGIEVPLRGPSVPDHNIGANCIAFLGAAQTFGHLCRYPFPNLVSDWLSAVPLNFGYGGAGPVFFNRESYLNYINKCRIAVIQVMSGRSSSNRYMTQTQGTSIVKINIPGVDKKQMQAHDAFHLLTEKLGRDALTIAIKESIADYIAQYKNLLQNISIPKILVWISDREPTYSYDISNSTTGEILNSFPHLIDQNTLNTLSDLVDQTVISYTTEGEGRNILNFEYSPVAVERKQLMSGNIIPVRSYGKIYPTPYLHGITAMKLYKSLVSIG